MRTFWPMSKPLQAWMGENKETDESLSRKVGVSRVQIRRIRLGENHPSRDTALKLEQITGISAATLVFGEAA